MASQNSARAKTFEQVLGPLDDDEFWRTSGSDLAQPSVEAAVARNADLATGQGNSELGSAERSVSEKGRGAGPQAPSPARGSGRAGAHRQVVQDPSDQRGSSAPRVAGTWLDVLRPRNARRSIATGRIAVRMPEGLMRCFNATARARATKKSLLFERIVVGFLDRLDRDGPELLAALQRDLELGPQLALEDDTWSDTGAQIAFADQGSQLPMAQMSHAVGLEVERRFDETSWRLQVAKDALGRLIVAGYLLRLIRHHPELEASVGFTVDDLRQLVAALAR
jgi:hypothetical protein